MRDKGYIKLSRKFFSNRMWNEARVFSECEAWLDLIQSARFEATVTIEHIGGREVSYTRGQYPAAVSFLLKRWGWSSDKKVRNFLDRLKREGMITTDSKQGMNVITLCKYDEYNSSENSKGEPKGKGLGNSIDQELNELAIQLGELKARQKAIEGQPEGNNNKKVNKEKKEKKESTIVDSKETPSGDAACAEVDPILFPSEKPVKTWREDFSVYKADLDSAYQSLLSDATFASGRLKFYKNLDVCLSLEKAYTDYWNTEAGWKKKKASRSKDLNWTKTFVNAIDLKSNRVYVSAGAYVPVTEDQISFTDYLKANAPLMLKIPIQPTDEEIAKLRKIPRETMLDIVKEINNSRFLTNGRNSVYETIMERINKREQ